jgi:hypothetical protein
MRRQSDWFKQEFQKLIDRKTYSLDMNHIAFSEGADDLSFVDRSIVFS